MRVQAVPRHPFLRLKRFSHLDDRVKSLRTAPGQSFPTPNVSHFHNEKVSPIVHMILVLQESNLIWTLNFGQCPKVDHEHQLRKEGKLEEVEKQVVNSHLEGTIKDFEVWIDELINTNETFVTEQGDVEKWDGSGKAQLLKYKEEALEYLKKQKKE